MGAAISRRAKSGKNLVLKSEPRGALIIDTGTGEMKLLAAMKVGDGAPVEFHELAINKGDTMTMVVARSSGDTTGFDALCTSFAAGLEKLLTIPGHSGPARDVVWISLDEEAKEATFASCSHDQASTKRQNELYSRFCKLFLEFPQHGTIRQDKLYAS